MKAYSGISFVENSNVTSSNNTAVLGGGAIKSDVNCIISIHDHSTLKFKNNRAISGGSVSLKDSIFKIGGDSCVIFSDNIAVGILSGNVGYGGAIKLANSILYFEGNSNVLITRNYAKESGRALYFVNSATYFKGNSNVKFIRNNTTSHGGAMFFDEFLQFK